MVTFRPPKRAVIAAGSFVTLYPLLFPRDSWAEIRALFSDQLEVILGQGEFGLREFLRSFLPEYMVPAIFVRLDKLPLSAHGKVDRHALPVPDAANTLRDEAFTSPRTALETEVGEIITDLLNTSELGVHDNFFLLGGSSFLGIQVIARVREKFGVQVPVRALFEGPTIAELAARIAELCAADQASL